MNYDKLFQQLERQNISRTSLVKNGIISSETLQHLRFNETVSLRSLELLSCFLDCGICDLITADYECQNQMNFPES